MHHRGCLGLDTSDGLPVSLLRSWISFCHFTQTTARVSYIIEYRQLLLALTLLAYRLAII